MYKYFKINEESTIDELKNQYKKLALKFHPDRNRGNDTTKIMQEINSEYERAIKEIGQVHNKKYSVDFEFMELIDKLIKLNMQAITIEICGWFVYISGNTKSYKEELKSLRLNDGSKLWWNGQKQAWYYKPLWYQKKDKRVWNMNEIRDAFGRQVITEERALEG